MQYIPGMILHCFAIVSYKWSNFAEYGSMNHMKPRELQLGHEKTNLYNSLHIGKFSQYNRKTIINTMLVQLPYSLHSQLNSMICICISSTYCIISNSSCKFIYMNVYIYISITYKHFLSIAQSTSQCSFPQQLWIYIHKCHHINITYKHIASIALSPSQRNICIYSLNEQVHGLFYNQGYW